jgi:crossover junction endodeoxyribonuclease RuvC
MIVCSHDPGLDGAMAGVSERGFLFVVDYPLFVIKRGKATKRLLDIGGLSELMIAHVADHTFIEEVGTRPGEGRVSAFNFGRTFGGIEGLAMGLGRPHSLITPQRWQRLAGCGPSPDEARRRAGQLYPDAIPFLTRKRDAGRADAILIAYAGLRLLQMVQPMAAE